MSEPVVRVPLQVGVTSLRSAVIGAGLIAPGLFLVGWGFRLGGLGWLVVVVGLALAAAALLSLVVAWRERPSDLLITPEAIRIEGGPHHGFVTPRGLVERVSLRQDLRGAASSLEVALADGSSRVLGHGETLVERERERERAAMEHLRDLLLGRSTEVRSLAAPSARSTTKFAAFVLLCIIAAWPLTAALYARMDHQNVATTKTLLALAFAPLLVWADGYAVLRARIAFRRTTRTPELQRAERRKWRLALVPSLPLLAVSLLLAKAFAAESSDVVPTTAAHGFEGTPSTPPPPRKPNEHLSIKDGALFFDERPIVTTEPGVAIVAISPDPSGTRVAYIRTDAAGQKSARVAFTQRGEQKDADAPVVSDEAEFVVWSPMRQQLAFGTWKKPVHVGIVATPFVKDAPAANSGFGAEKPITGAGEWATDPVWSPDGSKLAYISYGTERFGVHQIYVTDASFEKPPTKLTQGDADCTDLDWASDGWIWFTASRRRQRIEP